MPPEFQAFWVASRSRLWTPIGLQAFAQILFPVPTTQSDLQSLCDQFNEYYQFPTPYTLGQLDVGGLDELQRRSGGLGHAGGRLRGTQMS